jgi:hypothetical protein
MLPSVLKTHQFTTEAAVSFFTAEVVKTLANCNELMAGRGCRTAQERGGLA